MKLTPDMVGLLFKIHFNPPSNSDGMVFVLVELNGEQAVISNGYSGGEKTVRLQDIAAAFEIDLVVARTVRNGATNNMTQLARALNSASYTPAGLTKETVAAAC